MNEYIVKYVEEGFICQVTIKADDLIQAIVEARKRHSQVIGAEQILDDIFLSEL